MHWKKAADRLFKNTEVVLRGENSHYILKGLEPGTPYEVKIRAFNDHYDSPFSNVKGFSTLTEQQGIVVPPLYMESFIETINLFIIKSYIRGRDIVSCC